MDMWCKQNDIIHRLIPVGVKELNGKVENTHKQDDREFFSQGTYKSYESIELNTRGYNERWNGQRKTRALGNKTPNQVIETAAVRAMVLMLHLQTEKNKAAYNLNQDGDALSPPAPVLNNTPPDCKEYPRNYFPRPFLFLKTGCLRNQPVSAIVVPANEKS